MPREDPSAPTRDGVRAATEAMRQIRDDCVWTREITHTDLIPYLLEETAELADAIESGTRADLREELGDVLWQVMFHAEIASRDADEPFDLDDVAAGLYEKMVRRHPHVFAGVSAPTPEDVLVVWNAAKAAEKSDRTSVLDGVSERMETLSLAQKTLGRAERVGIHTTPAADVADRDELGDQLFALIARAQAEGWDAAAEVRRRIRELSDRVRAAEAANPDETTI